MKATFTYNKETKTLNGQAGDMTWVACIADEVYVIGNEPLFMTEAALMDLDGKTGEVKFPDGFAEELASGRMYPKSFSCGVESSPGIEIKEVKFELGDNGNTIIPGRGAGIASVTSIKHMGPSLLKDLYAVDDDMKVMTPPCPTPYTGLPHDVTEVRTFETLEKAKGFVSGVEYVNDSAISARMSLNGTATVWISDTDALIEEDPDA